MFYISTCHKTDSVASCVVSNFTAPSDTNLILNKFSHLEIYIMLDTLKLVVDVQLHGRIATVTTFRPPNHATDLLFVSTEKHKIFVLSFDQESHRVKTEAFGDVVDPKARPADCNLL
jgi:hypothetical protein